MCYDVIIILQIHGEYLAMGRVVNLKYFIIENFTLMKYFIEILKNIFFLRLR
jgi:hypothetical protein